MKTRNIRRQFDVVYDLGYKNLLVSGCSFTYNNSDDTSVSWPYYLRDLANVEQVYDCSMPGAGNYHICHSTMWACENLDLDINNTLVVVMWSGYNRDDIICNANSVDDYPFVFNYTNTVVAGITGGNHSTASGSVGVLRDIDKIKNQQSRSVENYLYIVSLYNYLQSKKYKFLFLDFVDRSIPNRSHDFEIRNFLNENLRRKYDSLFEVGIENLYKFAVKNDLLMEDDFHPTPDAHLRWTKEYLLPYIINQNQLQT
jgi:hypothetical protein